MTELEKLYEQQALYKLYLNADYLFLKLGYKKYGNDKAPRGIRYKNKRGSHIDFRNYDKTIDVSNGSNTNKVLTLRQIDAINKKIVELGWIKK